MARQPPWSVKGVDDEARRIARDAAEAAGLPIGAWIDRAILRATAGTDAPDRYAPGPRPEPSLREGRPEPGDTPRAPRIGEAAPDTEHLRVMSAMAPPIDPVRPRRGKPLAFLGGTLAIALLLAAGLWVMDRLDAPVAPAPREAAQPPTDPAPRAAPDGDGAATAMPAAPAPAVPETGPERLRRMAEAARAGDTDAQYDMGVLYSRGEDVPRDDSAAAEWFERAALRGMAAAQHNLGVLHEQGRGVEENPQLAFFWYQSAAEQGHAGAQHNLGTLYAEGSGTPRNYEKAAALFAQAADGGIAESHYSLGLLHEHGLGVAMDPALARERYRKAAEAGNQKAAARLRQMAAPPDGAAPQPGPETARLIRTREPPPEASAPVRSAPLTRAGIIELQRLLRELDFDPGAADGIAGARTVDAIRLYQQFAGLAVDGEPTEALLQDLRQVVGTMDADRAPPARTGGR